MNNTQQSAALLARLNKTFDAGNGCHIDDAMKLLHKCADAFATPAPADARVLRDALQRIVDFAGDPRTPIYTAVKLRGIARAALAATPAAGGDAIYAAYKTWPDNIRNKLSLHDLRRMNGWTPRTDTDDWRIDTSAGRPILVHKDCSVIESEQARYVLGLIHKDATEQASVQDSGAEELVHFCKALPSMQHHDNDTRVSLSIEDFEKLRIAAAENATPQPAAQEPFA